MWNPSIRPYGEYFAKDQALTTNAVAANQPYQGDNVFRNAQGGSAIRMIVSKAAPLVLAAGTTVTLTVTATNKANSTVSVGTGAMTYATAATLPPDAAVAEFILPWMVEDYYDISVSVSASTAPTSGTIDVVPHYISAPR